MGKPIGTERYTLDLDRELNQAFTEFAQRCGRPKAKLARLALVLLMQYEPEAVALLLQQSASLSLCQQKWLQGLSTHPEAADLE